MSMATQESADWSGKPALVVCGMHRSGTSTLTRVCNLLGAELGEGLIAPLPNDNDLGFWELQELVDAHEAMLEHSGLTHLTAQPMPEDWRSNPALEPYIHTLTRRAAKECAEHTLWAVKDPRMCRLMPVWLELFKEIHACPRFLISIRHPLEVAKSLEKRNGLPMEEGLRLWCLYNLELERHTRGFPRYFVHYPDMLTTWPQHMRAAQDVLGITWPRSMDDAKESINAFLQPSLYRNRAQAVPYNVQEQNLHERIYAVLHTAFLKQQVDSVAMDVLSRQITAEATGKPRKGKSLLRRLFG